jgi:hypothetical protein
MPTIGKVLGFGHTAAYAQNDQGDDNNQGDEDVDDGDQQ